MRTPSARTIRDACILVDAPFDTVSEHGERAGKGATALLGRCHTDRNQDDAVTDTDRPKGHEAENENLRPDRDGQAPRPATEPQGAEGSSNSGETATDPATGRPNP